MNRVLNKKGSVVLEKTGKLPEKVKGRIRFDEVDVESHPFIDFREAMGGRKAQLYHRRKRRGVAMGYAEYLRDHEAGETGGFKRMDFLTLKQAKDDPQYQDLIDQISQQAKRIISLLG